MTYKIYHDPWIHLIENNYFPDVFFKKIQTVSKDFDQGYYTLETILDLKELNDYISFKTFEYRKLLISIVSNPYNTLPCSVQDSVLEKRIAIFNPGGYVRNLHTDLRQKQITTIVFLSEQGLGTELYPSNKYENLTQIEWKENRALTFIPTKDTYHDFDHPTDLFTEDRATLLINVYNKKEWNRRR